MYLSPVFACVPGPVLFYVVFGPIGACWRYLNYPFELYAFIVRVVCIVHTLQIISPMQFYFARGFLLE